MPRRAQQLSDPIRAVREWQPAAHGASIDRRTFAAIAVFEAVERQALQVLLGDEVREHRRRGQRARKSPVRHRRGRNGEFLLRVEHAVLRAGNHKATMATALPGQLVAFLEADALGLSVSSSPTGLGTASAARPPGNDIGS